MSMLELTPDFIKEFAAYLTSGSADLQQRHDMAKLHVAERCGDEGALQRADTEKPVCAVPYQPQCEGT